MGSILIQLDFSTPFYSYQIMLVTSQMICCSSSVLSNHFSPRVGPSQTFAASIAYRHQAGRNTSEQIHLVLCTCLAAVITHFL